jgi:hypothetical protein
MSLWIRLFDRKDGIGQPTVGRTPRPVSSRQSSSPAPMRGSPSTICPSCRRTFNALWVGCPRCSSNETSLTDGPEWFAVLQTHVTAVQANDTAVQLFREGQLDDAIVALRRGLEANPHYATGYSNLGFLYLRKGEIEQAVECLLRALEVDPQHKDAPDHLFDVLGALIDELVRIGLTDGFLSTRPGGLFDDHNRHRRTREIGALIAKIGIRGVFKAEDRVLERDLLLEIVINAVQKKMGEHSRSTCLRFAWQGILGWHPVVAITLPSLAHAARLPPRSAP